MTAVRIEQGDELVGIVGMGLMGSAIFDRVAASSGWDIDPQKSRNASSARDVFEKCDVVFLCLPNSDITLRVIEDQPWKHGAIAIDTGTGDPDQIRSIAAYLAERSVSYLEATVSGSSAQVQAGEVLVMTGGDPQVAERCRSLLQRFAKDLIHVGTCGAATEMKLITNLVLGLNRAALAEGLVLAGSLGVQPDLALSVLKRSMAYSRIMDTKGEKMIRKDFVPQAKLSQHLKDVNLMLQLCGTNLPLSNTHRQLLEKAVRLGWGDEDNSAIIKAIEQS